MKLELYQPNSLDHKNVDEMIDQMDANNKLLEGIDDRAKAAGTILGRYVRVPVADGNATYQVIKVNKITARIKVCTGMGDDYKVPYWGDEATVGLGYIQQNIRGRDMMAEMVKNRKIA